MTLSAIQKAELDRGILVIDLDSIERVIANHDSTPLTVTATEIHTEKLNKLEVLIRECHTRIVYQQPADLDPHQLQFVSINTRIDEAKLKLRDIKKSLTQPTPSTSAPPAHQNVKLPKIPIPTFDGKYEEWTSFEDLFQAQIGSNASLTDAQKLQYLKGALDGDPANLTKSFLITDQNYSEAWNLLSTRYNNKRIIVFNLGKKIINQQQMKQESISALQTLHDTTTESIRLLRVLGQPADKLDCLLVPLIVERFDPQTKAEWAKTLKSTLPTTFKEVTEFMESHIRSLHARGDTISSTSNNSKQVNKQSNYSSSKSTRTFHVQAAPATCSLCKGSHNLYQCPKLLDMASAQRMSAVKKTSACLNCLRDGHAVRDCKSKHSCRHCSKRHHSLLHADGQQQGQVSSNQDCTSSTTPAASQTVRTNVTSSSPEGSSSQRLFQTAIVEIEDSTGVRRPCRVLYDNGSEAEYITDRCARSLGLQRQNADVIVEGVAGVTAAHARSKVNARMFSRVYNDNINVENLYVIPRITGYVPRLSCSRDKLSYLSSLPLADPQFDKPGEIDILIGTGVVSYIMKEGIKYGTREQPVAYNSIFGWVLSGVTSSTRQQTFRTHHTTCSLEKLVHRFWDVEQLPPRKILTEEEAQAEAHFTNTHSRKPDGRYVVRLPFNSKKEAIGETREMAVRRLHQLEARFKKHHQQHQEYKKFMKEYLDLGHMEVATGSTKRVYIPHHFVTKEDSTTTKLRVVFDASMKSSSGVSLNDALLVGATIQDELFTQLIRFRTFTVALKADIAKMYRQFEVHEDDRNYQTILWREDSSQPIQEYHLKTVTYGTASAPFLATRCLLQLAKDEESKFPRAAKLLHDLFYVDDFMGGSETPQESISLINELCELCQSAGLEIRKWCSSNTDVMSKLDPSLLEMNSSHGFDETSHVKALGIKWKPQEDHFYFDVEDKKPAVQITKREVLSQIARTFDPIGWLTPTTVIAKILFQDLWRITEDWDALVSEEIRERWNIYQLQLQHAAKIKIPRCIIPPNPTNIQLHGFADSSEKSMACCLYLRCTDISGAFTCHLITSKSKIAPLKLTSIPRLELNAAVLLAETVEAVSKCFNFQYTVHCWTDSMITLNWLTSPSRRWKTYVATRVATIQDVIPRRCWNHVRSSDNPADLPSRGILAEELIKNDLWWHGPSWLMTDTFPVSQSTVEEEEILKEERTQVTTALLVSQDEDPVNKIFQFSSLRKIISTAAWYVRFLKYLQSKKQCFTGPLTAEERHNATRAVIRIVQRLLFFPEITSLMKKKPVPVNSRLNQLNPILDSHGILRVGGRLHNAKLFNSTKHPIIIPHNHQLTTTIVREYHVNLLHGGFTLTYASLRRKYWILRGRDVVRRITRKCVTCKKIRAATSEQLMGNLPPARVTPHRPFLHCGVDFAGPFHVRTRRGRGAAPDKGYMALFVCFSTKAVHLEFVSSLSTDDFIACYRRFSSRRGIPSHIYSDCGTNFQGAEKELQKMLQQSSSEYQQALGSHGTTWVFNPPSAPHQGGLWEAAVKSAKYHIKRIIGSRITTIGQFQTLLCNVEACMNSRPLCALSSDPTDYDVLTPGHFLIGEPLMTVPEGDIRSVPDNRLDHWQLVQQMTQHFWNRWHQEYLITMQQRSKWRKIEKNLAIGDLVVIKEDNMPPAKWRLGRVTATYKGSDGLVRKANIKTMSGEFVRPINKLCIIIANDES